MSTSLYIYTRALFFILHQYLDLILKKVRALAQAVIRRRVITESRVSTRAICAGRSGTETGLYRISSLLSRK